MKGSDRVGQFDERAIDAIFDDVNQCVLPGVAVGIALGGRPIYRRGFGLANMELPVMLSPTIRMRIASVTKHFACLAYLLLCEEGRAAIDDTLGKILPELHPVTRAVTIRQLMGHVSGLRDASDLCWQLSGAGTPVSFEDLVSYYRDISDVDFAPESSWSYNNGAYLLLSAAIERVAGERFGTVLRERIFEPVGMFDTAVRGWETDFMPNSATGHMTNLSGGYEKSYVNTEKAGEGGMVSTVDDLLRWLRHMDAPIVGSSATWELLRKPLELPNGSSTGYGLGLESGTYRGVETLSHSGGLMGWNSYMLKVLGPKLDVVVLSNRQDVLSPDFAYRIVDVMVRDLDTKPVRKATEFASGVFVSETTHRVIRLYEESGKQLASINGGDMPFEADDEGVLRPARASVFKFAIRLNASGSGLSGIQLDNFGNVEELVAYTPAHSMDISAIQGQYRSESTGGKLTIVSRADGPALVTVGRFGSSDYRLERLAANVWRARTRSAMGAWGGVLVFRPQGRSFYFSTFCTRAILFEAMN